MKSDLLTQLRKPPILRKIDIVLTVLPFVLWFTAVQSREVIIDARCQNQIQLCDKNRVNPLDRSTIGVDVPGADSWSYVTQNVSGYLAGGVPIALHLGSAVLGVHPLGRALTLLGTDFALFAQTAAWNGTFTELARLIVQRPRPFVYEAPEKWAAAKGNYTSFYSGHTSFAAAANVCLFLILLSRAVPLWGLILTSLTGTGLIVATAVFRVISSRHFITDTLTGAIAGATVAIVVAWLHRPKSSLTA